MTHDELLHLAIRPQHPAPPDAPLEWLVTNGLGGYASGSVAGAPDRRFHGLLVAAHPSPLGRSLLLHALDVQVERPGRRTQQLLASPDAHPQDLPAADFYLRAGLPHWALSLDDDVVVEQAVLMPHGQNTVHVRFRLRGDAGPVGLHLRPWLSFRPHEGVLERHQTGGYLARPAGDGRVECAHARFPLTLRLQVSGGASFDLDNAMERDHVVYAIERDRGYDHIGSMASPLTARVPLAADHEVYLTASTEPWAALDALPPAAAWTAELARRQHLLAASAPALQRTETFLLPLAADQFIVTAVARQSDATRAHALGAEPRTIIAGYPWFTDWGRDTMISLEGLTLVTGRHEQARDILLTFARHVRDGLIPNLFPEGHQQGLYHTADATLWFFEALHRYDQGANDPSLVAELLPVLEDIVQRHRAGTAFNIRVERDGLLAQGEDGRQLTWMDALVDGWVVTPRRGKAVEINALWYNALRLLATWLVREGAADRAAELIAEAERCRHAFNARFWNAAGEGLFDVVDGEQGNDDACRPNQVLAIALPFPVLDEARWAAVFSTVERELLTPLGMRTLAPSHADFKARYFGDLRARDAAYHQGTVWPWLLGPMVDAWLKVRPHDRAGARGLLPPLLRHLVQEACVGSISEICDAEVPFTPRGCMAQAWSVAELARLIVLLGDAPLNDQTPPPGEPAA
jgi:predicted glycogen debranching enzyme